MEQHMISALKNQFLGWDAAMLYSKGLAGSSQNLPKTYRFDKK
jgi:hypothetical protein